MKSIYLATSWRNTVQPAVLQRLQSEGYGVYDFRSPHGEPGFGFSDIELIDPDTQRRWDHNQCSPEAYLEAMKTPLAGWGFHRDYRALKMADAVVLLLPCERDAHLELGWAVGAGKETHILLDNPCKASLMYHMVDFIHTTVDELVSTLRFSRV